MGSILKLFGKAKKIHDAVEDVKEIKEQVEDVVDKVKGKPEGVPVAGIPHQHPKTEAPPVLGNSWTPSSTPGVGGRFLLFRGGHPVFEYDGDWVTCRIDAGVKLPPGGQRGDVWRQIDERG